MCVGGSFLPPRVLFVPYVLYLCIKPLAEIIRSFQVGCHQYADDIQIYISLSKPSEATVEVLAQGLEDMVKWQRNNKAQLYSDKTDYLAGLDLPALDGVKLSFLDGVKGFKMLFNHISLMNKQVSADARNA